MDRCGFTIRLLSNRYLLAVYKSSLSQAAMRGFADGAAFDVENLPGKTGEPYKSCGPHIRDKESINPPMSSSFYRCSVCRAIFGNKAELNRHILTHSGGAKGGGEGMYSERRVPRGSRWW
jgi:hypothetical protein